MKRVTLDLSSLLTPYWMTPPSLASVKPDELIIALTKDNTIYFCAAWEASPGQWHTSLPEYGLEFDAKYNPQPRIVGWQRATL